MSFHCVYHKFKPKVEGEQKNNLFGNWVRCNFLLFFGAQVPLMRFSSYFHHKSNSWHFPAFYSLSPIRGISTFFRTLVPLTGSCCCLEARLQFVQFFLFCGTNVPLTRFHSVLGQRWVRFTGYICSFRAYVPLTRFFRFLGAWVPFTRLFPFFGA